MAKRGTFGGSRFGSPTYGKSGFNRGFGRASFGRKGMELEEGGITKDMMDFFKSMQSGNFGMKRSKGGAQEPKPVAPGIAYPGPIMGYPQPVNPGPVATAAISPVGNKPGPAPKPKAAPTGTPKSTPVKFRPKLLKLGR